MLCGASERMEVMGYCRKEVEDALNENKYNDVMAIYLLLSRKVTEVCQAYAVSHVVWSVGCLLELVVNLSCSNVALSSSSACPELERSGFHEVLPVFSILGASPSRVEAMIMRLEICSQGM